MEIVIKCCCGLDVHRSSISANLRRKGTRGKKRLDEVRKFGTMTKDLLLLSDWLKEAGCTHVAMESTGVFWKPVFNILENDFEVILVNAKHVKMVPGRKTDTNDCCWLAQLLQHGLLKASFIPPRPIRELRDLTRQRRKLVQERTSVENRIHKVLQDANIKLSSVMSNVMGKSGTEMLNLIVLGITDPEQLAECARGKLKSKKEELKESLEGKISSHHRFLLSQHLKQIRFIDSVVEEYSREIEMKFKEQGEDFLALIPLLSTIPGVDSRSSEELIAEIGADMNQFPTAGHLSSWAGVCPGNNESAGKRKSGKTTGGNRWLKATLGEVAWGAGRTKNTYLVEHYGRIKRRRGKKRAIVAVGHTVLVTVYHMIKNRKPYMELGNDFYVKRASNSHKYHVKKLEKLGYKVVLEKSGSAA